jgi:hypothetical protein
MDIRVNGQRYRYWRDIPHNVQQALIDSGVFLDGNGEGTPKELLPQFHPPSGMPVQYELMVNGERYGPHRPVPGLLASVLHSVGSPTDPQAAQRRRGPRMGRARPQKGWNLSPTEPGPPDTWNRADMKPIVNWVGPRLASGRKQPPPLGSGRRAAQDRPQPTRETSFQPRQTPGTATPAPRIKAPPMRPPPTRQQQGTQQSSAAKAPMINKKGDAAGNRNQPPPVMTHRDTARPLPRPASRRPRQEEQDEGPPMASTTINPSGMGSPSGMAGPPRPLVYGSWQGPNPYGESEHRGSGVISEVGQRSTLFVVLGVVAAVILVILLLALTGV